MAEERTSTGKSETVQELEDRFIENWGEISALWGVPRTIGRIHALLYLTGAPVHMEAISKRLQISHGNCSTSLRDLLAWGVIRRVHVPGERKAYYESEPDPWTWFHSCISERRRREIKPLQDSLHDVRDYAKQLHAEADSEGKAELAGTSDRVERFTKFIDEFMMLVDAFLAAGHGPLGKALRTVAKAMPKRKE